jgi:hypothetical protein
VGLVLMPEVRLVGWVAILAASRSLLAGQEEVAVAHRAAQTVWQH